MIIRQFELGLGFLCFCFWFIFISTFLFRAHVLKCQGLELGLNASFRIVLLVDITYFACFATYIYYGKVSIWIKGGQDLKIIRPL